MKRNAPRLSLTKRGFFARQLSVVFFNANFTDRSFIGFKKKYFTSWGQKIFVLKWYKISKTFFQRHIFGSKGNWALQFLSQGLAWGTWFIQKMCKFLAYHIHDRSFNVSSTFNLYNFDLNKKSYILLSKIVGKVEEEGYQPYKNSMFAVFDIVEAF